MSPRPVETAPVVGEDATVLPPWLQDQVGRRFPGGRFRLEPWLNWLVCDAVSAPPPTGRVAHPLMPWVACTLAMGVTWHELFAWFGSNADDGPMFGQHRTVFHEDMLVDQEYEVSGQITAVQRKSGRSLGVFDLVAYEFELRDGQRGRSVIAECHNSLVLPRRTTEAPGG